MSRETEPSRSLSHFAPWVLIAAAVCLSLWKIDAHPPPWWDEGWTMQVARNWVERGHYGRLLDGAPAPKTLAAGVVVTGPVAASFALLGHGFWQARWTTVLWFAVASILLYALTSRIFDPTIAAVGLLLAVFLSPLPSGSALLFARQVLGEWAMLALLLGGLLLLRSALERRAWLCIAASLAFALGVNAKAQLEPFLLAALLAGAGWALWEGERRGAAIVLATFAGSIVAVRLVAALQGLLPGFAQDRYDLRELYASTVLVLDASARAQAVRRALLGALPYAVALYWTGLHLRGIRGAANRCVAAVLLALSAGWLVWFVALSAGWPRYLFPAIYLASPFLAAMACTWLRHPPVRLWARAAAIALCLQVVATGSWALLRLGWLRFDSQVREAARVLNQDIPAGSLIETYESELIFLLEGRYHYPPITVHVEAMKRHRGVDTAITYDPLSSDPDYIVTGGFSSAALLYEPVVEAGHFRLVRTIGAYRIFERVR